MLENKVFSGNRDFKGIWIPREIWLRKDISMQEKCLWAEIHSLFDRQKGGCFASNDYLSQFLGIKERRLQEMVSSLKAKGLIVQISFNGRERIIKAVLPAEDFSPIDEPDPSGCGAEVHYPAPLGCGKAHLSDAERCTSLIYRDKSLDKRIENTHPNPQRGKSAKADEREKFGEYVKLKKQEHQALCDEHGKEVIDTLIEEMNDYCLASRTEGYKDYAAAMRQWLRKRKKEKVSAKKDRKFAPCSDDEGALECMNEMRKTAI